MLDLVYQKRISLIMTVADDLIFFNRYLRL